MKKILKNAAFGLFMVASLVFTGLLTTNLALDVYYGVSETIELHKAKEQLKADYLQTLKRPLVPVTEKKS